MNLETFKILHSEIIMYCQIIEGDIKWIYSFMHKGDEFEIRDAINKKSMGEIIEMLQELDNESNNPFISEDDYIYLKRMKNKRNYWCHQAYVDFIYIDEFINSVDYKKVCEKLKRDHDRLEILCSNVENAKLKAISVFN